MKDDELFLNGDDLSAYLCQYENLITTLSKHQEKMAEKMNQPIYFRDLVAASLSDGKGEALISGAPMGADNSRLGLLIKIIFEWVNTEHRDYYCEESAEGFTLKKGKENHITRLSTPEFFFYTHSPLSMGAYSRLYCKIYDLAKELEPNVHVLLSSFAVQDEDNKILNIALYIQSASSPKIHAFCKTTASKIDVTYSNSTLFSQQKGKHNVYNASAAVSSRKTEKTHKVMKLNNINTQVRYMDSMIPIVTKGGASCYVFIDICLDHLNGRSKQTLRRHLKYEGKLHTLPNQVEHCVTSNSVDLEYKYCISKFVMHADKKYSMHTVYDTPLCQKDLTDDMLKKIASLSKNMDILKYPLGYEVQNPPFGSTFIIERLKERPASDWRRLYRTKINNYNQSILRNRFYSIVENREENPEKLKQAFDLLLSQKTLNAIRGSLQELAANLSYIISKFDHAHNHDATKIVYQRMNSINQYIVNDKSCFNKVIFQLSGWAKNLKVELSNLYVNDNDMRQSVMQVIENCIDTLQKKVKFNFSTDETLNLEKLAQPSGQMLAIMP